MTRSSTLVLVGVLTILTPFIGIPSAWRDFIFIVLGLIVVVVGFLIRSDRIKALKEATPAAEPLHNDPSSIA